MGKLASGSLNRLIQIQRKCLQEGDWGQGEERWVKHCNVYAGFKTLTGSGFARAEFVAADREVSRVLTSIRIRWRGDITAGMRVVYRKRAYGIVQVLPDEEGQEYVDLAVTQGVNCGS